MTTGHSLGGGVAKLVGLNKSISAVSISGPGVYYAAISKFEG